MLSGERLPGLLMTIIRFVLPSNDHQIKKLLLVFWEIWPKTTADGKLLHEMILVCDAYRKVSSLNTGIMLSGLWPETGHLLTRLNTWFVLKGYCIYLLVVVVHSMTVI